MPRHQEKSNNQVHLENSTYEEIVLHFEKQLELSGLEVPDGMQTNAVTQQATKPNPEKHKALCHLCENQDTTETIVLNSRTKERETPK